MGVICIMISKHPFVKMNKILEKMESDTISALMKGYPTFQLGSDF